MKNVALLGVTGSIGQSALDVVAQYPERYRVWAIAAGSNVEKLARLASVWRPYVVAIADQSRYNALVKELKHLGINDIRVMAGPEAMCEIASMDQVDIVVQAIVGAAGVKPSFAAARAGKRLLLANKESVVCGGELLMRTVREHGAELLPVDSEHNAIFQCLEGTRKDERSLVKAWLTCSGGPFHARTEVDLESVTPQMALAHPTWSMGRKISIDSATLMNKGLEVIEAHHLFNLDADHIGVVVHPQSVIHSMVEFSDGSLLAELASPDMKLPIVYCMAYPQRLDGGVKRLKVTELQNLTFTAPDMERFPQLAYAYEAVREGGISAIVLNAANEIAVEAFLQERIGFKDIARVCRAMMDEIKGELPDTEDGIMAVDAMVRERATAWIEAMPQR